MNPGGLSEREAAARLAAEGHNELPRPDRRGLLVIMRGVVLEPMFAMLLAAGIGYLFIGGPEEGVLLLSCAVLSASIAIVQEHRSEAVIDALRDLSSPRATVVRDGRRRRVAGREVARGDIVVLAEGERVPADGRVLAGQDLEADESMLTGESVPVRKVPGAGAQALVHAGTLVVGGEGTIEVTATGRRSELGKIGLALGTITRAPTRLARETRRLVRIVAGIAVALSLATLVIHGLWLDGWIDGLLGGLALGMALVPEELPLILVVFTVMGALRLSRSHVLVRQAATIETLGAATVLCTDKTGTLTRNQMAIAEIAAGTAIRLGEGADRGSLPEAARQAVIHGVLASAAAPFDPMEQAFHALGADVAPGGIGVGLDLIHRYGLCPDLLAVGQVWATADRGAWTVAAKGAPEAIASLCRLTDAEAAGLRQAADAMAGRGLRVLAVARAAFAGGPLPPSLRDFGFSHLGLVGLADPLRDSVPAAVRDCRTAGIRVVMITGDYPVTAQAVARQAGIDGDVVVSGDEIDRLDDTALGRRVSQAAVFARIMPQQKLRIVEALKAGGAVVAMTGDGVNDAPSLKAADIGIAMGGRGTDVAREAASIVLLDDDFESIVAAIRQGRRIHDNLRKAMGFIFAIHVPIAGLALLPLLFGLPALFTPVHIAFLEMAIDPICSIVFEAETEEADIMQRPPRPVDARIFSGRLIAWSLVQGGVVLSALTALWFAALSRLMPEAELRSLIFTALVASSAVLLLVNRSFGRSPVTALLRPNRFLWPVIGVVGGALALTLGWAPARAVFHFGPLHGDDIGLVALVGCTVLAVLELLKPAIRAGGRIAASRRQPVPGSPRGS